VTRDGVGGLVCLAGSLLLLWTSRDIAQPALVPIGPAFYPRIVLGVTAALSLALLASDLWRRRRAPAPSAWLAVSYRLVLLTFLVFALYVFALPWLGYRVSTLLFVAVLQSTLAPPRRGRDWALVAVIAVASMLLTYYVFERQLHVLLPRGRLTGF
jgi:drug/metabolite transporter (DMT)-like permease